MSHVEKLQQVIHEFLDYQLESYRQKGFIICLSGGVDSSTLLKLIADRYGASRVIGFTTVLDDFSNPQDIDDAKDLCAQLGVMHIVKNVTQLCAAFLETMPELNSQPIDNIASRIRVGIACELAVKLNLRLVFAAPLTEWALSGIPVGCDAAHCYPFAGLYKAEILALAEHIGLPQKFLKKKPSNSAVAGKQVDKTTMYFGIPLSIIDKIVAHLNGLIPRNAVKDIDDKTLMQIEFLLRYFEPDIDIRGLSSCHNLDTPERREFLANIPGFPFENHFET